jgi:hypothetical protein
MKSKIILIFALLPAVALADSYRETRNLELPAGGVKTLKVSCGAGSLTLKGIDGIDLIRVIAEIQADNVDKDEFQLMADQLIELDLKSEYDRALLLGNPIKQPFTNVETRINLYVELPFGMNVKINDGSGPIVVSDIIGNLEIDDDSGSIQIENVTGQVRIKDGSGDIEIEDVRGDLEIVDGSGEIQIQAVTGDVTVKDTSGGIEINDIGGSVTVSDGSGSIDIYKVQKNVFIRESESGKIDVDGVKGQVTIRQ